MKCIIYHEPGKETCVILHVAPEILDATSRTRALVPELEELSDDEIIEWVANKDTPKCIEYSIIDSSLIPSSRKFRNAWVLKEGQLTIDLAKAKELKIEEFRVLRKPLLENLDADFMKQQEVNGDLSPIVLRKNELRDVTTISLPDNIEELEAFVPKCLIGA